MICATNLHFNHSSSNKFSPRIILILAKLHSLLLFALFSGFTPLDLIVINAELLTAGDAGIPNF